MLRVAACAAGILCLAACGGTIALPINPSSGPPTANYPAADLRARITLLYGEHTYALGKLVAAAIAGHKDEFASYAGLLATNGDDLAAAVSKAAGDSQGTAFLQARVLGDGFYIDYVVAATTQQQDMSGLALQNLTNKYTPQMAQVLSSTLGISTGTANKLVSDEVSATRHFVDDAATPSFYSDLRSAYAKAVAMGGSVAEALAWKFADKYPGDVNAAGATLRAQLDAMLQEHSLLATMATSPLSAKGANDSLQANTDALARVIGSAFGTNADSQASKTWSDENQGLAAYASAPDDQTRQSALDNLNQNVTPELASFLNGLHINVDAAGEVKAAIQVIDDQRAKSYDRVATDDRDAAVLLVEIGDALTAS